jgi:tripartite-type tricarboxylate transporter receptor subunit TctC
MKIKSLVIFGITVLVFILPTQAAEVGFPTKPIQMIIGTSPGGGTDVLMRAAIPSAEKILGQPIVAENKPAGVGMLALEVLKSAKPDGYTLGITTGDNITVSPHSVGVKYDAFNDFTYILSWGMQMQAVVVKSDSPFRTFQDLIDFAKKNPGKLTHGCPCVACSIDLPIEKIAQIEKVKLQRVYFKGSAPTVTAVLGGHVMCASMISAAFLPHVKAGTMRLLALFEEIKEFPEVPAFKSLGYDFKVPLGPLHIITAPKGVPKPIVQKLVAAFSEATKSTEFRNVATATSQIVFYLSGDELRQTLESQSKFYGELVKEMGPQK